MASPEVCHIGKDLHKVIWKNQNIAMCLTASNLPSVICAVILKIQLAIG